MRPRRKAPGPHLKFFPDLKKMEDKWVLSQHEEYLFDLVKTTPEFIDIKKRAIDFNFTRLPRDIKLLILSYCNLWDIRRIALVCKEWSGFLGEVIIWEKHILRRLRKKDKRPIWRQRFVEISRLPFYKVPNKICFGWLFVGMPIVIHSGKTKGFDRIGIGTPFDYYIEYSFASELTVCEEYKVLHREENMQGWLFRTQNSKESLKFYMGNLGKYGVIPKKSEAYIIRMTDPGIRYEGESFDSLAHGKGEWKFPDGRIFKGDKVAFGNLPHGKGLNEIGEPVSYLGGYLKTDLDKAWRKEAKRRKKGL